ncbi:MAG: nucleotide exchange factor GrpE [Opitutae bacterium]|nr:nucleotide exchange factor GrpE [Opitutae bacterium]
MDQESEKIKSKEEEQNPDSEESIDNNEDLSAESENADSKTSNQNLNKRVQETYSKNEDLQDKYVRVLADLENLKRRQIKERDEAVQRTRSQIMGDLLPSLDAFQMGMQEAEKDESTKNIFVGISMAFKQMENVLGEYGLEIINPDGSEFDPKFHEALSYQESDDVKEGFVLKTIRIGYRIKDKLLRPASVIISKGKEEGGD